MLYADPGIRTKYEKITEHAWLQLIPFFLSAYGVYWIQDLFFRLLVGVVSIYHSLPSIHCVYHSANVMKQKQAPYHHPSLVHTPLRTTLPHPAPEDRVESTRIAKIPSVTKYHRCRFCTLIGGKDQLMVGGSEWALGILALLWALIGPPG